MTEPNIAASRLGTYIDLRQRIVNGNHDPTVIEQFTKEAVQLAKLRPELIKSILDAYVERNGHKPK